MAIYSKLSNVRKLTNSSLGSIIDVSNLNFTDLSSAVLEYLNNVSYNETTNAIEGLNTLDVKYINVSNNFSVKLNGVTTFNIDSQGRAEGNSFLVEVAEAKRYRHTDFNNWPDIGIPGEIIYTGVQNQKPEFGEDFIGYLDGRGWVSLTEGGGAYYTLTLLEQIGSPGIPNTPDPGTGIVWIGDPLLATSTTPTTQDLYFTDENGEIFSLTSGSSGGGGTITTKNILWGLMTNWAAGTNPEFCDWAGVLSPTGTHNSSLPIPFDLTIKRITLKYLDTTPASVDASFNYEVSIGKLNNPNGSSENANYVDLTGGANVLTLTNANVNGTHFLLEASGLDIVVSSGDVLMLRGNVTAGLNTGGSNEEIMVSVEYEKNYSGGGSGADEKVKISSADTTTSFLEDKLVAGANITLNKLNTGANEQIEIVALSGGGGSNTAYVETTGFTANVTKTITHSLVADGIVVDLIDEDTGNRIDGHLDNYTINTVDITLTQDAANVKIVIVSAGGTVNKAAVTFTPGVVGVANTLTHGLGTQDIIVQLWDVTTGEVLAPADISNATSTTVDVTFGVNPAGDVKAVII